MLTSFDRDLEKYDGFETEYVKILYYDLPANYKGSYRTHAYARMCTILEGKKHIDVKNKYFDYDKDQSLLLPAHSKVEMAISQPTKALVFEFSDKLIEHIAHYGHFEDSLQGGNVKEVLVNNHQTNIERDLQQLIQLGNQSKTEEAFMIDIYAQKLIHGLLSNRIASRALLQQEKSPVDHITRYITDHIDQQGTLSEIAGHFNMSVSNFSHTFKRHTGQSPQQFILAKRMEYAKAMLATETVTDVALSLGYENISYFIRVFKNTYGMTPKQYQLRNIRK